VCGSWLLQNEGRKVQVNMKFEYKILNMSEVTNKIAEDKTKKLNFTGVLNAYGIQGWELMFKLTDQSFLMKRKLLPTSTLNDSGIPDHHP
jgi:hypothetical protein